MTVAEIQKAILDGQFTDRELRDINGTLVNRLKKKRAAANRAAKAKLYVGQEVTWGGPFGHKGKIVKINRTRAIVDTGGYRNWTVPMTMLEAV